MSFLSSSVSSSSLSTPTGSTSPLRFHSVYPSFLPLHGIHSLYAAILETPIVLHAIKEIPLVTVEDPPIPFSPFSLADCTTLSHFSFNNFIAIAFPDIAGDLDIQI